MGEPVLCYIDGCWAYFTTKKLTEQWGDDWNDAPYEHNAGQPYYPCWHNMPEKRNDPTLKRGWKHGTQTPLDVGELCRCDACKRDWNEDGTPRFEVVRVAWDGPFKVPCDGCLNSSYSVEQINAGHIAWLRPDYGSKTKAAIPAGTTLSEFRRLVTEAGGAVYEQSKGDTQ